MEGKASLAMAYRALEERPGFLDIRVRLSLSFSSPFLLFQFGVRLYLLLLFRFFLCMCNFFMIESGFSLIAFNFHGEMADICFCVLQAKRKEFAEWAKENDQSDTR